MWKLIDFIMNSMLIKNLTVSRNINFIAINLNFRRKACLQIQECRASAWGGGWFIQLSFSPGIFINLLNKVD